MPQLIVRSLEEEVKSALRVRAARNGRSMEEEVRAILRQVVKAANPEAGLGTRIAAHFKTWGLRDGEALPEPRGEWMRPVKFDEE